MRPYLLAVSIAILLAPAAIAGKFKVDEPPKVEISGKVTDAHGVSVVGAQVILIDRETHQNMQAKTDKSGSFAVKHNHSSFESMQVIPPVNSRLAQAVLKDLPADDSRHVLVSLKPGVVVSGRVLSGNKPLKGVTVRAIAKSRDVVHESGETTTNGKGQFKLLLAPGQKIIEITDVRDSSVTGLYREKQMVTTGGALPDIVIPSNSTAGLSN